MKFRHNSLLFLFLPGFIMASAQDKTVSIAFDFTKNQELNVKVSPLKFYKDFAFSFALDDALDDAYTLAFPLLSSLNFTDGCGNLIPFTAGIAWYTANSADNDLHHGSPGYLTYAQGYELYHSRWDLLNHSYNHSSNRPGIDFLDQITRNQSSVMSHIGVKMRYMVPPSGDTNYIQPALNLGHLAVITSNTNFSGFPNGVPVGQTIKDKRPVYWRNLLNSDVQTVIQMKESFDQRVKNSTADNPLWFNEFTHRVAHYHTGASVYYEDFESYFTHIETHYGSPGGDNGWFASASEVYDYLLTRDNVQFVTSVNNSQLIVKLDYTAVPDNLRYYNLSFLVSGASTLSLVNQPQAGYVTLAKKAGDYLVNIQFQDGQFSEVFSIPFQNNPSLFTCYPNPATQNLFIQLSDRLLNIETRVKLFSLDGQCLFESTNFSESRLLSINLQMLDIKPGIYLVVLDNKEYMFQTEAIIVGK